MLGSNTEDSFAQIVSSSITPLNLVLSVCRRPTLIVAIEGPRSKGVVRVSKNRGSPSAAFGCPFTDMYSLPPGEEVLPVAEIVLLDLYHAIMWYQTPFFTPDSSDVTGPCVPPPAFTPEVTVANSPEEEWPIPNLNCSKSGS